MSSALHLEDPCGQCGATEGYLEDGDIFCDHGHRQGRAPAEAEDEGRHGRTIRKEKEKTKEKIHRIFKGRKAYKLFLQAWQHVLWKQCYALVHIHGLPSELWNIVRDLWELRLSKLADRYQNVEKVEEDHQGNSEVSNMETEASGIVPEDQTSLHGVKTARKASDSPKLIDVAALNYLGILILRNALDLRTFFTWLETESIPYVRAIRHIPKEMKDRLPAAYQEALDTTSLLRPQDLQLAVSQMATMHTTTFGITIPPLNFHLTLLSYIESLALPVQTYKTVKHLNTILNFSFKYPLSQTARLSATSFPEVQLISLLTIAAKLQFPFDNKQRHPQSLSSPSALLLNWQSWLEAKTTYDEAISSSHDSPIKPGTELSLQDTDILSMTPTQLDAYMSFYQRMFANLDRVQKIEGVAGRILDLFPLTPLPELSAADLAAKAKHHVENTRHLKLTRIRSVQSTLSSRHAIDSSEETSPLESGEIASHVARPGSYYQIFRKAEDLDGAARVFHQEAADLTCTSLEALVRAVRSTEEKIEKWRRERRREEVFGKSEEQENLETMDVDADVED